MQHAFGKTNSVATISIWSEFNWGCECLRLALKMHVSSEYSDHNFVVSFKSSNISCNIMKSNMSCLY